MHKHKHMRQCVNMHMQCSVPRKVETVEYAKHAGGVVQSHILQLDSLSSPWEQEA